MGIQIGPPDENGGDGLPDGINCQRPCPFVSCKNHLFVDLNQRTGGMKLNFPKFDVWQLSSMSAEELADLDDETIKVMESENPGSTFPSCSLDVADVLGVTMGKVGSYLNVTRERIRQLEKSAKHKYKSELIETAFCELEKLSELGELTPDRDTELRSLVETQAEEIESDFFQYQTSGFYEE